MRTRLDVHADHDVHAVAAVFWRVYCGAEDGDGEFELCLICGRKGDGMGKG